MPNEIKLEQIERFNDDLKQCIECGNCTFWCPVYEENPVEAYVARGKIEIIRGILSGEEEYTPEAIDVLGLCTLCSTCAEHCPIGCQVQSIIIAARADKVKTKGLSPLSKLIYQQVIPRRILFGNLVRIASWLQRIFLPRAEGNVRHLPLFLSALGKGRQIPSIAPKFLRQMAPVTNRPPDGVNTKMRVGYFIGCATDFVFSDVGRKVIDFLTSHGVEVVVPREQGCCGAPIWLGVGDFETGRKLADNTVKAFASVDCIITNCATCTNALTEYPKYLADTPERVKAYTAFGDKIKHVTAFLVDILKLPPSEYEPSPEVKGKTVTWHDPCHLNRYLGIKDQPRQLMRSIPDVKYVEMTRADRCCGMAGAFSINHYDVSKKIADKKAETIGETKADFVATDCPGCMIQLMDTMKRQNLPQKVKHIMELLK